MVSKRTSYGEFETVWSVVNAVDKCTALEDKFNSKATLNRQEFLQCIVRCAITIYVKRGAIGDVSDAVTQMLSSNMLPNVPAAALQNSNAFRKRFCYTEKASRVLEAHMGSLTALYATYAEVGQAMTDVLRDDSLLSVGEWMSFVGHLGLLSSGQLSTLKAKQIFLWSRIRTAKDLSEASERRLRHLSLVDFLEALVRMSIMVALPTDMELEEAGARDAGEFLLAMQANSPNEYLSFLSTHRPRFTDPDGSDYDAHSLQPSHRALEHLLHLLVRTVEHNTSSVAAQQESAADGTVERSEAAKFLKRRSGGLELQRFEASLREVRARSVRERAQEHKHISARKCTRTCTCACTHAHALMHSCTCTYFGCGVQ